MLKCCFLSCLLQFPNPPGILSIFFAEIILLNYRILGVSSWSASVCLPHRLTNGNRLFFFYFDINLEINSCFLKTLSYNWHTMNYTLRLSTDICIHSWHHIHHDTLETITTIKIMNVDILSSFAYPFKTCLALPRSLSLQANTALLSISVDYFAFCISRLKMESYRIYFFFFLDLVSFTQHNHSDIHPFVECINNSFLFH